MKYSLILAALACIFLLPSCTSALTAQNTPAACPTGSKEALIERITQLPDYCVYEESKPQFIERLHRGDYWVEHKGSDTVEYLYIGGDGCWSCRLFMLVNNTDLYILIDDWEGDPKPTEDYVLRHNAQTNELGDFCSAPKSILDADSPDYTRPTRAWFRLLKTQAEQPT